MKGGGIRPKEEGIQPGPDRTSDCWDNFVNGAFLLETRHADSRESDAYRSCPQDRDSEVTIQSTITLGTATLFRARAKFTVTMRSAVNRTTSTSTRRYSLR
ncbi:MAG: hypothetical protein DWI21_17005 [Planctomycetota bacterium]|nr:MAG: hypothetical protein DWI21_17005 [Planctomycetota bacterium]